MGRRFRYVNIHAYESSECQLLGQFFQENNKGFHAFYGHGLTIASLFNLSKSNAQRSSNIIYEVFDKNGVGFKFPLIEENKNIHFEKKISYLLGFREKPAIYFPERALIFGQKLREELSNKDNVYNNAPGYAFYQASISNLLSYAFDSSPIYDAGGIYREYILWNDNGLWEKKDWQKRGEDLKEQYQQIVDVELWLAWFGSGWLSSRMEDSVNNNRSQNYGNELPYPTEINTWAPEALTRLENYDEVTLRYFESRYEEHQTVPHGWQKWHDYIATLCDFLPYHRSRFAGAEKTDYIPSNGLGDRGGARLWQGFLGPYMTMHTRQLLLDGWLTLWPVDEDGQERLYYQPASLALLYWAAKQANKPYTDTPQSFIDNYQWLKSGKWFGGRWPKQEQAHGE